MLTDELLRFDNLPQRSATQVKNKWADLVREVRAAGSVAITHHNKVEMVVVDASTYQRMVALAEGAKERHHAALAELSAEFDRRLAALKSPETRNRVEAVMKARGRTKVRPKAGVSF
jgi:prevent-host-death family protein